MPTRGTTVLVYLGRPILSLYCRRVAGGLSHTGSHTFAYLKQPIPYMHLGYIMHSPHFNRYNITFHLGWYAAYTWIYYDTSSRLAHVRCYIIPMLGLMLLNDYVVCPHLGPPGLWVADGTSHTHTWGTSYRPPGLHRNACVDAGAAYWRYHYLFPRISVFRNPSIIRLYAHTQAHYVCIILCRLSYPIPMSIQSLGRPGLHIYPSLPCLCVSGGLSQAWTGHACTSAPKWPILCTLMHGSDGLWVCLVYMYLNGISYAHAWANQACTLQTANPRPLS